MHHYALMSMFSRMTWKRFQQLKEKIGSTDDLFLLEKRDLYEIHWKDDLIADFFSWRKNIDIDEIEKNLARHDIHIVVHGDPHYPKLLHALYDPPISLYIRGELSEVPFPIAIVGSRKTSSYGEQMTREISLQLGGAGATLMSGLARGIDSIVHESALEAGAKTIAVLGSGIDDKSIAPANHLNLAKKIVASGGAIISEYPPGTAANIYTFPARNRIIAGLSRVTIVTEAAEKSGALITASCAIDQGRDLYALPHNITSPSGVGANTLIEQGARPLLSVERLLSDLGMDQEGKRARTLPPLTTREEELLHHISFEQSHIDDIIRAVQLPTSEMLSLLLTLEMKGYLIKASPNSYRRR